MREQSKGLAINGTPSLTVSGYYPPDTVFLFFSAHIL